MIEVVFVDAGETLLRPHPSFPELFAQVCRDAGVEVEPSRVAEVQDAIAPHLVDLAEDTGVTQPSLSAEDSQRFWTHLYKTFLRELGLEDEGLSSALYRKFSTSSSYALFDDALPALLALDEAGYRLGLISNFEEWLQDILVEQDAGHLFDVTVISGLAGVEKPDPRIYEIALEEAGVPPERCVHVGDSPTLDLEPAASLSIRPILIDRHGRYLDRYRNSEVPYITSLEELPGLLSKL